MRDARRVIGRFRNGRGAAEPPCGGHRGDAHPVVERRFRQRFAVNCQHRVAGDAAARSERDDGKEKGAQRRYHSDGSGHDAGTLAEKTQVRLSTVSVVAGYAASRITPSSASAALTTAGKRSLPSAGTRSDTCERP